MALEEVVYEYFSETAGEWYDSTDVHSDLHLAAKLGKTLLERNKELAAALRSQQQQCEEQALEIEHLNKQVESIKQRNESRLRVYEQMDCSMVELEKKNEKLRQERIDDKEKLKRLSEHIDLLQLQNDELQSLVSQQAHGCRGKEQCERHSFLEPTTLRRYRSFENGFSDRIFEDNEVACNAEIRRLQGCVKYLKKQQTLERQRRNDAEKEISSCLQENVSLQQKLEEAELIFQAKITSLNNELQSSECKFHTKHCPTCSEKLKSQNCTFESEFENEDQAEFRNPARFRLRSGSSLYGSQKSLNINKQDIVEEERQPILSEIHSHYHELVQKYEDILGKHDCSGSKTGKSVHIDSSFKDATVQADPSWFSDTKHLLPKSDKNIPEYKKLFKEIFDTLQRQHQCFYTPRAPTTNTIV